MNTISVYYESNAYRKLITKKDAANFINLVLAEINTCNVELSVTFCSKNSIHELNKEYRNIDNPTDILSFAFQEELDDFNFIVPGRKKKNIGDMVICPEVLSENASTFGVSENEELHRLLIHGVLHLTGSNHLTNDATEPMLVKQEQILKKLSVNLK